MMLAHISSELIPSGPFVQEDCAWCWYAEHPHTSFPEHWSSTICAFHEDWQLARLAARRASVKTVNFVLIDTPQPDPLSFPFVNRACRFPEYPRNWSRISWTVRRSCGFRCEWCGGSEHVSVHHMGSAYPTGKPSHRTDKRDTRRENLYVLCGECHEWIENHLRNLEKQALRKHRSLGIGTGLVVVK